MQQGFVFQPKSAAMSSTKLTEEQSDELNEVKPASQVNLSGINIKPYNFGIRIQNCIFTHD